MKKLLKKMSALFVAMAMVMAMCMTVSADTSVTLTNAPSSNDKGIITVEGVEGEATVTAYKVVEAQYDLNDGSFIGYRDLSDELGTDVDDVDQEKIETITQKILNNQLPGLDTITLKYVDGVYKTVDESGNAAAPVGSYVILVSKTNSAAIYSPMYGSVYYSTTTDGSGNQITSGNIDVVNGSNLYVKKQIAPTPDKEILQGNDDTTKETVTIGSVVTYELSATIPSYIDGYKDLKFNFIDTLSKGLTYNEDSYVLYVNGKETISTDNLDFSIVAATDGSGAHVLTFELTPAFILSNGNNVVSIRYTATVNGNAVSGFNGNNNSVKLEYSNDPSNSEYSDPAEKKTYTFDIKGDLLYKTDVTGNTNLSGAKFALFTNEACTVRATYADGNVIPEATSTAGTTGKCSIDFTKLNEGTYYLKETVAPANYQLSSKILKIEISADINSSNGNMNSYTIKITDMDTDKVVFDQTFTQDYTTIAEGVQIKNTQLSALPSTGGIGTYVFTIVGVILMAAAAGILFIKRRRSAE